jgi:hypothetical protein
MVLFLNDLSLIGSRVVLSMREVNELYSYRLFALSKLK